MMDSQPLQDSPMAGLGEEAEDKDSGSEGGESSTTTSDEEVELLRIHSQGCILIKDDVEVACQASQDHAAKTTAPAPPVTGEEKSMSVDQGKDSYETQAKAARAVEEILESEDETQAPSRGVFKVGPRGVAVSSNITWTLLYITTDINYKYKNYNY